MGTLILPQIVRGDDWDYVVTFTLSSGSLVGCKVWMTLKTDMNLTDGQAAIQVSTDPAVGGVTVIDATTAEFVLTASQTAALEPGSYYVDIQAKTQAGAVITCKNLQKRTIVAADVTRAIV